MDYVYTPSNTSASSRLSSQAVIMQIINSISTIVNLFISSFLVSFIMSINANEPLSETLISVGLYNISLYVVFTLVYFGISYIPDIKNQINPSILSGSCFRYLGRKNKKKKSDSCLLSVFFV